MWHTAVDLFPLDPGNAYGALACLFGIRNSFGFHPLAGGRGLPTDASAGLRDTFRAWGGDARGTTLISWTELEAADWDATDASGRISRRSVAGPGTGWAAVRGVMRTSAGLHEVSYVRLVVRFDRAWDGTSGTVRRPRLAARTRTA
ncbi:hypothetical protein [Streptomyces sp. NPDC057403]|uniref:hypothetical protein n=1 Tax=Streptomyces sp. NPDC057403 TaxID=3346119 RepID=UPI003695BD63